MSESVVYPNILWHVENLIPMTKKEGPDVPLLLAKWKLKLVTCSSVGGDKVKVFLNRIADHTYSVESYFYIVTSIHSNEVKCLESITKVPTTSTKLCIWEATVDQLSECNVNFRYCVDIFVSFVPGRDWRNFDGIKFETGAEEPFRPCLPVLSQDFGNLLSSGTHADVVLICEGKTFMAHRAILGARSDKFRTKLQSVAASQQEVIDITDVDATVLEGLLRYLYIGEIPDVSSPSAQNTFEAVIKYGVGCWSLSRQL